MFLRKSLKGLLLSFALLSANVISIRSSLNRASFMILLRKIFCSFLGIVLNAVRKTSAVIPCVFMCSTSFTLTPVEFDVLYHITHLEHFLLTCASLLIFVSSCVSSLYLLMVHQYISKDVQLSMIVDGLTYCTSADANTFSRKYLLRLLGVLISTFRPPNMSDNSCSMS